MRRFAQRYGYRLLLTALLLLIVISGAFVVVVALPDLRASDTASPQPTAAALPSEATVGMSWLSLPADAECSSCHLTDQGAIGVRNVPAVAHPLKGWTDCTACHANDRLVMTAPGHTGIHATDCLLCHQAAQLPAPLSRPHRDLQNQECLSCHGSKAPLPADMSHRAQSVCWLCHRLPQVEPPVSQHAVTAGQRDCLTCHIAGLEGALPADHATRDIDECLLCHAQQPVSAPTQLPPLATPTSSGEPPLVSITRTGWWATIR